MKQKKTKVPKAISVYMAELGRKGGAAGKGDPNRRELNRKAAQARWAKYRAAKKGKDA